MATFNSLPAELRNKIYEFVVDVTEGANRIKIKTKNVHPYKQQQFKTHSSLILTSKQTNKEYYSILHRQAFNDSKTPITAGVVDLDFAHVIRFVNSWSAEEEDKLMSNSKKPTLQLDLSLLGLTESELCRRVMQWASFLGYIGFENVEYTAVGVHTPRSITAALRVQLRDIYRELYVEGEKIQCEQLSKIGVSVWETPFFF